MTTTPIRSERPWASLAEVPPGLRNTVASRVAERLFSGAVRRLPVTVHHAGRTLGLGGPSMVIHRPEEFFARLGRDGLIGFGESYLTGAWDVPESGDLGGFLTVLAAELPNLIPAPLQRLRAAYVRRPPRLQQNTETNTRGNIAHHYDLSNELFALFLDRTLSYSAALFDASIAERCERGAEMGAEGLTEGHRHLVASPPERDEPLETAQVRKIERLLDQAGVTAGSRVLEIGTGWGELAIRAARRGATVHSVTLSSEQLDLARERVAAAGFADRVTVELCDYRAVTGSYDAVVSVEMIEAVGHEYWSTYFQTIDRVLAPGGRVALQAITMPHDRMLATRRTWTWINKYIFPGGFLPSVRALDEVTRRDTTLRMTSRLSFGRHYAETLRRWDSSFRAAGREVGRLGFDATFARMWHFYLEYSRAGFASGYLDVQQLVFERTR